MKLSNTLLGLGIGVFACGAAALSLGEARGSVVLGRPIDLVFDVQTDPGTDLDVACMRATAVAGETQIDNSRLRIVAQPLVAGRAPSVRIHSSVAVMEPILTVHLAMGCSGAVSRTYHFFADLPAGVSSGNLPVLIAPLAVPLAALANSETVAVQRSGAAVPRQSARVASAAAASAPPYPRGRRHPPSKNAAPSRGGVKLAPQLPRKTAAAATPVLPTVQPHSRLVMEPLDQGLAAPSQVGLSPNLKSVPPEIPNAHGTQATALGQALNTAVEDLEQANQRLLQQQVDLMAARASSAKMQVALTDLQQRMERLDRERFSPTLVYGLLGLLMLALALLGWLWIRTQSVWQRSGPASRHSDILHPSGSVVVPRNEETTPHPIEPSVMLSPLAPDTPPALPDATALPVVPTAAAPVTEELPLAEYSVLRVVPAARVVHPEELFDLQQQAEFFMSVGEHDQAIEVMKKHIAENEGTSPSVYLELLRLYRALSRVEDFSHLRAQFHQYFNAQVPEFSDFHEAHRTLFDYPEPLASIEAVWNDASVLRLLESYIFCSNEGNTVGRFELEAYDDLLMLYAISSTTPASARGATMLRQRTTPRTTQALQSAGLQASVLLDKSVDGDLNANLDKPLGRETKTVAAPPVEDNLIEFENFLLSENVVLGAVPLAPHHTKKSEWTLDVDLTELADSNFDQARPEFTQTDGGSVLGASAQAVHTHPDPFEVLFDLEKRDPGRS